ncbi:unnamed protein product [Arabidopsis thaliana]|uniref:DUF1664 domain-containing protein n=3 Tax=Arabidopsis TaxID=3701 RepID=A0A654EE96_ARATH|nr:unnamed protein product [Arabidopsis thaliana]
MALPLGKLTILIGAGLIGSAFAKEGGLPDVSNLVSGAFKMVFRQLKQDEPSKSASKPHDDVLVAQVNSLRHEIQLLGSNRPITIVSPSGSGGRNYGLIIIVGVIGYGYVWWKGWKLPDFMFATRRSLSDACNNVGNQIDGFYSSLKGTKRELSSEIDMMGRRLDANTEVIQETIQEVAKLQDGTSFIKDDVKAVFDAFENLASKVCRIEGNQDITLRGVGALHAQCQENQRIQESNKALPSTSSLPALEAAPMAPSSKTLSLPPASPDESQSPSTPNVAQKSRGLLQHTQSMSGLKDINESSSSHNTSSNGIYFGGNGASGSSSGVLGRFSIARIMRTRTVVNTVSTN